MTELGAIGALVSYGGAVLLLLVVRSWRASRRTGSSGFNALAGMAVGAADRVAGAGFALALVSGVASPVLVLGGVMPLLVPAQGWLVLGGFVLAGFVLAVAGVVLAVIAQETMGESWRIGVDRGERTELVTSGIFSLVRNPIFSAMLAVQLGTALMALSWMSVIGCAALLMAVEIQTRLVEEPYLVGSHGDRYRAYASQTGRFLPGLGRLSLPYEPQADGEVHA